MRSWPLSRSELQNLEESSSKQRSFRFSTKHHVTSAMSVGRSEQATRSTLTKQWLSWKFTRITFSKRDLLTAVHKKLAKTTKKIWKKPLTALVLRAIVWTSAWSKCKLRSNSARCLKKLALSSRLAKNWKQYCSRARLNLKNSKRRLKKFWPSRPSLKQTTWHKSPRRKSILMICWFLCRLWRMIETARLWVATRFEQGAKNTYASRPSQCSSLPMMAAFQSVEAFQIWIRFFKHGDSKIF